MQPHRHEEFIRFLSAIEAQAPAGKLPHAVLDNYATHKHPKVITWLARHPRRTFHFTPTSGSWLNTVENFVSRLNVGVSCVACSAQSLNCRQPSNAISRNTMPIQSHSSGPGQPSPSSISSLACLLPLCEPEH